MSSSEDHGPNASDTRLWGLFRRKTAWRLSWRAWLLVLALAAGAAWIVVFNAYSFLAVTQPLKTDVLVVEGWIDDWALRIAADEFKKKAYRVVFTTGGPVPGREYANDFNTVASVGAERLIAHGVPREVVHATPSREAARDRTYASAVALKRAFRETGFEVRAVNVITEAAHGRRTLLLFQEALGPEIAVGVISLASPDIDPSRWWRYSEGVRDVIGESIAYLYVKLLFSPS